MRQELAELLGAPVLLQGFSNLANFPNTDYHWQGELPGAQAAIQAANAGTSRGNASGQIVDSGLVGQASERF